ncbi:hypothetical protein [Asticcacaulis taihuensis]|uniref:hypothetical protein n=1 Tax=Asticcacaulis taihuensis TaxID=260084 RepID=UPI0026ED5B9C|nr:hypothetical protein [Asticcacaulis taihuensis]
MTEVYSVSLINRALEALGEEPIDAIDPNDLSEQPNAVIKLLGSYERAIGQTLRAIGRGPFISHVTLSPLELPGDWKWPYRFQLPADGLAFLDPGPCVGLELAIEAVGGIDQEVLRSTSDGEIQISYVRRCDVDLLSDEVFEALGLNIAARPAFQIVGSRDWAKRIEDKAEKAIVLARGSLPGSTDDMPRRHNRMARVRGACSR